MKLYENMKINWNKIIEDSFKTFLAAIMIGAGAIIWQGATSVNEKVAQSELRHTQLVKGISDELATIKIELITMRTFVTNRGNVIRSIGSGGDIPPEGISGWVLSASTNNVSTNSFDQQLEQKAFRADLIDKLQYKK